MNDASIHIVTISTDNKFYYPNLVESCKKNKGELITLGFGEKWRGYNWKFRKMIDYLSNLSDDKIVCFVDGYDVISCRDLTELADEFIKLKNKYKCKIVAGCDDYGYIGKNIFTRISFGKCDNHYLNSGTYIGYAKDLKDIITKIYELNPSDAADDQVLMIQYYNENPGEIYIDHECKLFLAFSSCPLMNVDEFTQIKIVNNKLHAVDYKSMPFFIHAPGNGLLDNIIIKMGYGIPDKNIKKDFTHYMIEKLYYHIPRIVVTHKYIFLSFLIITISCVVVVKFYIINKSRYNKIMNSSKKSYNKNL
jgi:hypothetical protein